MIDEGVVKYRLEWQPGAAPPAKEIAALIEWRDRLHSEGLIGHDETHDVGFGNISIRSKQEFIISGTQTGHIAKTAPEHYSRVVSFDIKANSIHCKGPISASSEALTHAGLYQLDARINAIVHIHSSELWNEWRGNLPTTAENVAYGTPAMAREFQRLYQHTPFGRDGVAVMGGHADGLISIGSNLEQAASRILDLKGT